MKKVFKGEQWAWTPGALEVAAGPSNTIVWVVISRGRSIRVDRDFIGITDYDVGCFTPPNWGWDERVQARQRSGRVVSSSRKGPGKMKTPKTPPGFDRFALQDAFGYAVCLAGHEMAFAPGERSQGEWNRLAITTLKKAGYAGPLFTGLKPRERGKRLAWAAHDLGRQHGVDAYTGEPADKYGYTPPPFPRSL